MDRSMITKEFIRGLNRQLRKRYPRKYSGNYEQIALAITKDRWNGKFFEAGREMDLSQFWIRDFGIHVEGLLHMDYAKEVHDNLDWALEIYSRYKHVFTTISAWNIAYDVYTFGADSLPMLLHALSFDSNKDLVEKYKTFLQEEIFRYYEKMFNPLTLSIKANTFYSIPKDVIARRNTAVANIFMVFMVKMLEAKYPFFENPFPPSDRLLDRFNEIFWKEDHYVNDVNDDGIILESSDPTMWAFWTGVIDPEKKKKALEWLKAKQFASPFPIKYHHQRYDYLSDFFSRIFKPNYQGDAIWTMISHAYIRYLYEFYPEEALAMLEKFIEVVEKNQNYYEIFDPEGVAPLKGRFGFGSGSGMVWIASLPKLHHDIKGLKN